MFQRVIDRLTRQLGSERSREALLVDGVLRSLGSEVVTRPAVVDIAATDETEAESRLERVHHVVARVFAFQHHDRPRVAFLRRALTVPPH